MRFSRRRFLFLGAGALALGGTGYWFGRRPVRLGLIGAGIQGTTLARAVRKTWWYGGPCGEIVAVCDVDQHHLAAVRHACCAGAEPYGDYRRLLEREDVQAVLVATPDHWHARIAAHALRAGKAVYCEKPLGLTIAEGHYLVNEVRRTSGVFLVGTMQRTDERFRTACALVRSGRLGNVHTVTVTLPRRWAGTADGPFATTAPPKELDWDQWLGQAPYVDYCPERCHGSFRRWYEYSGGQMTDWGAHHMDIVQWALGMDDAGPLTATASGDMPHIPNSYNTPIIFTADLVYPGGTRVRVQTDADYDNNGIRFEGDRGWLFVNRAKLEGSAVDELARRPLSGDALRLHPSPATRRRNPLVCHLAHFFRCIRGDEQPVSDVLSQHRTATTCHLANLALRLGRTLTWDAIAERVAGDAEANALLTRLQRSPYELPGLA